MSETGTTQPAQGRSPAVGQTSPQTKRPWVGVAIGAALLYGGYSMYGSYTAVPYQVLEEGKPGTFTLVNCEGVTGKRGTSTHCSGNFRSEDGSLRLKDYLLDEHQDASGLKQGDTFPARAMEPESRSMTVIRSDADGKSNINARAVGAGGIGVLGLGVMGFSGRSFLQGGRRRAAGWTAGVLCGAGIAMWFGGLGLGVGV